MKRLSFLIAALFAAQAHAVSVGTDGTQGTDTKTGQKLEDTQSMQMKKGSNKKKARGSEKRAEASSSQAGELAGSVSQEVSVGRLFFPLLAEIEALPHMRGDVADDIAIFTRLGQITEGRLMELSAGPRLNPYYIADNCRVFSQKKWVWGQNKGVATTTNYSNKGGVTKWEDEPPVAHTMNGNIDEVWTTRGGVAMFGNPDGAGVRLTCLATYAALIDVAAKSIAKGAKATTDKFSGARMFAVPSLDARARRALWEAFYSPAAIHRAQELEADVGRVKDCLIPTPNGLQQGKASVICGPFQYDQNAQVLIKNGVRLLADDTINGVKIAFAELARATDTVATKRSTSQFSNAEDSTESGKEVTVGKSKSKTMEAGTSGGQTRKSDVSATPGK